MAETNAGRQRSRTALKALVYLLVAIVSLQGCISLTEASHHKRQTWVVYNALPDEWDQVVLDEVADFQTHMPKRGPHIKYVDVEPKFCADTKHIEACTGDGFDQIDGQPYSGMAITLSSGDMHLLLATNADYWTDDYMHSTVCHEFMHIFGKINWDDYDSMPDSCIFGELPYLGPWDIQRLHDVWK